jgi:hypothetical protein
VTKDDADAGGTFFGQPHDPARTRQYFIAAEVDAWDFAPGGKDPVCGLTLPPALAAQHTAFKLRYFAYTDATFSTRLLPDAQLGILGPVLRGVVGETLAITFLNRTDVPLSMHPHGVKYDKDSEGAWYLPAPGRGAAVGPGARFTYVWKLDESSGPLPTEPSSKCWLYHSHVTGDAESNLGLIGAIIVTDPARARPDGTPADVDRELVALFMIFDESGWSEADEEAAESGGEAPAASWAELQQQREAASRYAINGRIFGNLPGLEMNEGERVRWYLLGLGSETDVHTAHWHGLRVVEDARHRTDVVELLPASMKIADLRADNPGSWLFHCHVAEHMRGGMFAGMRVHAKGSPGAKEVAFPGMRDAARSLRLLRAEITPAPDFSVRLTGIATVPDAFSVFTAPVQVRVGEKVVVFQPDTHGEARSADGTWRVRNASKFGVVYGGQMEFDARLSGEAWRTALEKSGEKAGESAAKLEIRVGEAVHQTEVALRIANP